MVEECHQKTCGKVMDCVLIGDMASSHTLQRMALFLLRLAAFTYFNLPSKEAKDVRQFVLAFVL